jgi:hypothetical protein
MSASSQKRTLDRYDLGKEKPRASLPERGLHLSIRAYLACPASHGTKPGQSYNQNEDGTGAGHRSVRKNQLVNHLSTGGDQVE